MNKKLLSIICTATLVAQSLPINVIAEINQEKVIEKNLDNKVTNDKKETSQDNQLKNDSNSIDKNKIIFNGNPGEVIGITFDSNTKKLKVQTYNRKFNNTGNIPGYVTIEVYGKDGNVKVPKISLSFTEIVNDLKLQKLKDYTFEYGDYLKIYHGHPFRFAITGGVIDEKENYADGVQNPENLLDTKFEITENGLKAVYKDPDEERIANNNIVFGPLAREKYPFKIEINFKEKRFKVVEVTQTQLVFGDTDEVYKIALMRKDSNGNIIKVRETSFKGTDIGSRVMSTTQSGSINNKNWNNQEFKDGDFVYIWHQEESRSIIKGNIKSLTRKLIDGVNSKNVNSGVFKIEEKGLELVYNGAPKITGADDVDVYVGQKFNLEDGVTYSDDKDKIVSTKIEAEGFTTQVPGEYIVTYTATNSWGISTVVKRKITVRPYLYRNIINVYSEHDVTEEVEQGPAFRIGFDTVTKKYRVFDQIDKKLSNTSLDTKVFGINIRDKYGEIKKEITLMGSDSGTSSKLSDLNNLNYDIGDTIEVYIKYLDCMTFEGDVEGDIPTVQEMEDDNNKVDYMTNTRFAVTNGGLQAKYNKGAKIHGINKSKVVSKSSSIDLLEGVTVTHDIDHDISKISIKVFVNDNPVKNNLGVCNYTFNEEGTYKVKYEITDSWGRTTIEESAITVQ